MQLASMPWDSIVMSMASVFMFSTLLAALAWGVLQSGLVISNAPNGIRQRNQIERASIESFAA